MLDIDKNIFVRVYDVVVNGKAIESKEDMNIWQGFTVNLRENLPTYDCRMWKANMEEDGSFVCEIEAGNRNNNERTLVVRSTGGNDDNILSNIIHKETLEFYQQGGPFECREYPSDSKYDLCMQISSDNADAKTRCIDCFGSGGIWTAVGCIPQDKDGIISTIMEIGLTLSGAVVLVMILIGSFMLSTSQGDPKKTQEAKEMITSAIIGLLFVIFSITILQFIGVSIFNIPGFGE